MRALLLALLLAGCASSPSSPAPIATSTRTVTANIPVAVPCIAPEDVPKVPTPIAVPPEASTYQRVVALAANKKALDRYAELADAAFVQCVKGATP
jgi:PBP1b-binding outer membrane lipoprotein LpoB